MGLVNLEVLVEKSYESPQGETVAFLADSGAVYSVVQGEVLRRLGIRPHRTRTFFLADGHRLERKIGDAHFEYKGVGGAAPVAFGEPGDADLLRATTPEALELVLDPFKQELRIFDTRPHGIPANGGLTTRYGAEGHEEDKSGNDPRRSSSSYRRHAIG